jgi:uncharacterized UBP type Zn finger protein
MARTTVCQHLPGTLEGPRAEVCEACGETRNLRACAECGHVGCCESLNAHNTAHYRQSGHPVIRSMPVEGGFTWCYACGTYL